MATESAYLWALDERGRGLRVWFTQIADRYAHAIDAFDGEHATRLLESVEGEPQESWPPSPALQGLNIDELESDEDGAMDFAEGPREGADVATGSAALRRPGPASAARPRTVRPAMLIGLAGTAHWSLSVEAAGTGLIFDAACRYKEPARQLGSRYSVSYAIMAAERGGGVELQFGWGRCRLRAEAVDRESAPPQWRLGRGKEVTTLACEPKALARPPATVRWKYVLEML